MSCSLIIFPRLGRAPKTICGQRVARERKVTTMIIKPICIAHCFSIEEAFRESSLGDKKAEKRFYHSLNEEVF
jgi:hypothetical protein